MASQPPANLPLFYKDLIPLSSSMHADFKVRTSETAPFLSGAHAIHHRPAFLPDRLLGRGRARSACAHGFE
jgi:hypothetical protein